MTGPASSVASIFDPQRLRIGRQGAGSTKQALAELVGVSPAAIGQYEAGTSRPSPDVLARLALALGYPIAFFARGRPTVNAELAHLRSLRSTTKTQRVQAEARAVLAWEVAHVLEQHVRLPAVDLPHASLSNAPTADEVESVALEARRFLGVADGPVPHMVRLLESRGVIVARLQVSTERVSAFSCPFPDRPVVMLSSNRDDKARSRMDAAHELGHLVMHHEVDPGSQILERQANSFGAAFLMPRDSIRPHLPPRLDWGVLTDLKRTWGVSLAALLFRSRTLGMMSEPSFRRAMVSLGSKRWSDGTTWRQREPGELGPPEQPALMRRALDVAASRGVSLESLADEIALPQSFVSELIGAGDDRPAVL